MKKRIQTIMVRQTGHKLYPAGRLLLAAAGFAVLAFPVLAQSQDASKPTFEVASVKPAKECGNATTTRLKIPQGQGFQPGGYYSRCSVLSWVIGDAYRTELNQDITGGPGWIEDTLYRIEAKAPGNPDKETMQLMLQSLLEDRFNLRIGHEAQEAPVYFLVVAEGGPRLQPAKDEDGNPMESLPSLEQRKEAHEKYMELMGKPRSRSEYLAAMPPGAFSILGGRQMTGKALSMEVLAAALTANTFPTTGRRVVDRTGITGLYDIKLHFRNPFQTMTGSNQLNLPATDSHVPTVESDPSIYTALEEQLGLKLEEGKAPLEHIVIESVERPTENKAQHASEFSNTVPSIDPSCDCPPAHLYPPGTCRYRQPGPGSLQQAAGTRRHGDGNTGGNKACGRNEPSRRLSLSRSDRRQLDYSG